MENWGGASVTDKETSANPATRQGILHEVRSTLGELFGPKPTPQQQLQVDVLFGLLGYVARADRLVSTEEAAYVNRLMDDLGLVISARKRAAESFSRGCRKEIDFDVEIQRFLDCFPRGSAEVARLYECLLQLAAADLRIHPKERELLRAVSKRLGFPVSELDARLQKILYVI